MNKCYWQVIGNLTATADIMEVSYLYTVHYAEELGVGETVADLVMSNEKAC
jgi:hypothetical protein